jgi:hypothetical protein
MATTSLDRLIHRAAMPEFEGKSYRSGALNTSSASHQATSALAQQMDNVDSNLLNENLSIQLPSTDSH